MDCRVKPDNDDSGEAACLRSPRTYAGTTMVGTCRAAPPTIAAHAFIGLAHWMCADGGSEGSCRLAWPGCHGRHCCGIMSR